MVDKFLEAEESGLSMRSLFERFQDSLMILALTHVEGALCEIDSIPGKEWKCVLEI